MTRVLVVASPRMQQALEPALTVEGIAVEAMLESMADADGIDRGGRRLVVIVEAEVLEDDDLLAAFDEAPIVIVGEASPWRDVLTRHHGGWAVVPAGAAPPVIAAAARLAADGLTVAPRDWIELKPENDPDTPAGRLAQDDGPEPQHEPLTSREQEVLALVADGLSNRGIAVRLGISEHTVKFHVSTIYGKLGAANRAEAVALAWQRGVIHI